MSFANGISNNGLYIAGCDSTANGNSAVYNTWTGQVTIVDDGAVAGWQSGSHGRQQQRRSCRREPPRRRGFVYIPGSGESYLANVIASGGTTGADYVQAVAVNNAGQILVQGTVASDTLGDEYTWLFTPVAATPEPSACVLAATGLLGLLAYAWRKRK